MIHTATLSDCQFFLKESGVLLDLKDAKLERGLIPRDAGTAGVNAVDLRVLQLFAPSCAPFIGRAFRHPGLRWPWRLGPIVLDSADRSKDIGKDSDGLLGVIGSEYGGFGCQGHDSVLELEFGFPGAVNARCDRHQSPGDYRHDRNGI